MFLWAEVSGTDQRLEATNPGCSAPQPPGGVPCARAAQPLSLLQLLEEPPRRGFGGLSSTWNIQLLLLIAGAVWDFRRRACVWRGGSVALTSQVWGTQGCAHILLGFGCRGSVPVSLPWEVGVMMQGSLTWMFPLLLAMTPGVAPHSSR